MRKQFRNTVTDLAMRDERIVLLLSDISVYLFDDFKKRFPDRFYNVGICENTLISVAAGLRKEGFIPFVHTIAPYITERSFEQIKLDMSYNALGGNIVSCGASFDYAWDGPSHHCYTDLALLRLLPDVEVIQPGSTGEVDSLIRSQYDNNKTTYFRLSDNPHNIDLPTRFGKGIVLEDKQADITVMTSGPILTNVLEASKEEDINLVYFHTLKPIDKELIQRFKNTRILVVQDAFGLYEAVSSIPGLSVACHGLPDRFLGDYGTPSDVHKEIGLDVAGIRQAIRRRIAESWRLTGISGS